jgi:hypothetical protein
MNLRILFLAVSETYNTYSFVESAIPVGKLRH